MKEILYVIADLSGSMSELGKNALMRNSLLLIMNLPVLRKDQFGKYKINIFAWFDSKLIDIQESDITTLVSSGETVLPELQDFLNQKCSKDTLYKVILLSDGHYLKNDINEFTKWIALNSSIKIITVAIGSDANIHNLKKISLHEQTYTSEEILIAISSICFGLQLSIPRPISLKEISNFNNLEEKNDWGE